MNINYSFKNAEVNKYVVVDGESVPQGVVWIGGTPFYSGCTPENIAEDTPAEEIELTEPEDGGINVLSPPDGDVRSSLGGAYRIALNHERTWAASASEVFEITEGDADFFRIDLQEDADLILASFGPTDVQAWLKDGDYEDLIQHNNDTPLLALQPNFEIFAPSLPAGRYYLAVNGYRGSTGTYGLSVVTFPPGTFDYEEKVQAKNSAYTTDPEVSEPADPVVSEPADPVVSEPADSSLQPCGRPDEHPDAEYIYSNGLSIIPIELPEQPSDTGDEVTYTYALEDLPPGLSFDPTTRTISGTPNVDLGGECSKTFLVTYLGLFESGTYKGLPATEIRFSIIIERD